MTAYEYLTLSLWVKAGICFGLGWWFIKFLGNCFFKLGENSPRKERSPTEWDKL